VLHLAVLPQRFSVVAQKDDGSALIELGALQPCDQPSQLAVGVRDLPVVGMLPVFGGVRRRRIIGTVRIVQVQPKEKWPAAMLAKPLQGSADASVCSALHEGQILLRIAARPK